MSSAGPGSPYKLVQAVYREQTYTEGTVWIDEARGEIEIRQMLGKKRRQEMVVARFKVEANAAVLIDDAVVKVSQLSVTFETPEIAGRVAEILRRPGREREAQKLLSEVEGSIGTFLETRQEAMASLARMKSDPRGALVSAESMWVGSDKDPVEAVYLGYSAKVAESLDKADALMMNSEKTLGAPVVDRLYALAYAVGAVQDTLFKGSSDLSSEVAALQELGVTTNAQELKVSGATLRLVPKAHTALVAILEARAAAPKQLSGAPPPNPS